MRLFKMVELKDDPEVQFVGVYVLRWRPEWGEPSVGFVEAETRVRCATCGTESTAMYCSKCYRELQAELFTAQGDASFWHHLDDEALSHAQYWKQRATELEEAQHLASVVASLHEILEEVRADCDRDVIETAVKAALLALGNARCSEKKQDLPDSRCAQ